LDPDRLKRPCFDLAFHGLVFFGSKIHGAKKHEIDLKCQTCARAVAAAEK